MSDGRVSEQGRVTAQSLEASLRLLSDARFGQLVPGEQRPQNTLAVMLTDIYLIQQSMQVLQANHSRPGDTRVQVPGPDGATRTVTLSELSQQVSAALERTLGTAQRLNLAAIEQDIRTVAQRLGIRADDLTLEQIQQRRRSADSPQLLLLENLMRLHQAPAQALQQALTFYMSQGRMADAHALTVRALTGAEFAQARAETRLHPNLRFGEIAQQAQDRIFDNQAETGERLARQLQAIEQRMGRRGAMSDGDLERCNRELTQLLQESRSIDRRFAQNMIDDLERRLRQDPRNEELQQQLRFWQVVGSIRPRAEFALADCLVEMGSRRFRREGSDHTESSRLFQRALPLLVSAGTLDPTFTMPAADLAALTQGMDRDARERLMQARARFDEMRRLALTGGRATEPFTHPLEAAEREARAMEGGPRSGSQAVFDEANRVAERNFDSAHSQAMATALQQELARVEQQMQGETDATRLQELRAYAANLAAYQERATADASAIPFTRYMRACCLAAAGSGNDARAIFESLRRDHPEFANRPQVRLQYMIDNCREVTFWDRVRGPLIEIASSLAAAAAGIATATVTAPLLGPAAPVAGVGAGAGTRVLVRSWLSGEDPRAEDLVWGGLDYLSAGAAGQARHALILRSVPAAEQAAFRAGVSAWRPTLLQATRANFVGGVTGGGVRATPDALLRLYQGEDPATVSTRFGRDLLFSGGTGMLNFRMPDLFGRVGGRTFGPAANPRFQGFGVTQGGNLVGGPFLAGYEGMRFVIEPPGPLEFTSPEALREFQRRWVHLGVPLQERDLRRPTRPRR